MNNFIHRAQQMGLLEMGYHKYQPNAAKCQTIQDVYKSHAENNEKVKVKLRDVYGILALLGHGFGLAVISVIAETCLPVSIIKWGGAFQTNFFVSPLPKIFSITITVDFAAKLALVK